MKIYTKTGDKGDTGLWGGARVRKDDPRVAAYGEVDELNCAVGAARDRLPEVADALKARLKAVQNDLFVIGSALAGFKTAIPDEKRLEAEIDEMTAALAPQEKFILPHGDLHLARAVCRRAERAVISLQRQTAIDPQIVVYLNRLSDHLFTAARWVDRMTGRTESFWEGLVAK